MGERERVREREKARAPIAAWLHPRGEKCLFDMSVSLAGFMAAIKN